MEKVIKLASWALSSFFLLTLIAQLLQLVNKDLYIWQFMEVTFLMAGVLCLRKIIINGFDLLKLLRASNIPQAQSVPVIAVTGQSYRKSHKIYIRKVRQTLQIPS